MSKSELRRRAECIANGFYEDYGGGIALRASRDAYELGFTDCFSEIKRLHALYYSIDQIIDFIGLYINEVKE